MWWTHTQEEFQGQGYKINPDQVESILSPSENAHWPVISLPFVWGTHSRIPSLTNTSWWRCCETTEKAPFWVYKHIHSELREECEVKVAKWLKCGLSAGIRINPAQSRLLTLLFQNKMPEKRQKHCLLLTEEFTKRQNIKPKCQTIKSLKCQMIRWENIWGGQL